MSDVQTVACYVKIGIPIPGNIIGETMEYVVFLEEETIVQAAKTIRKYIAKKFKVVCEGVKAYKVPSKLFWAVYESPEAKVPFLCSENTPKHIKLGKSEKKVYKRSEVTQAIIDDPLLPFLQNNPVVGQLLKENEKESKNGIRNHSKA